MLTLSTDLIEKKNQLAQSGAWIILVRIEVTGMKRLAFDARTEHFLLGDTIRQANGGTAVIVDQWDNGADEGDLILYNIQGTFTDNETITGDVQGSATIDGSIADYGTWWQWARNNEDVEWDRKEWTKSAIEIDTAQQSIEGKDTDLIVSIANMDSNFEDYVNRCFGLPDEELTVFLIHSDDATWSNTDKALEEVWNIRDCAVSPEWITFSVGNEPRLFQAFPRYRYEWSPCRYQFKDSDTCQDAGSTCNRKLVGGTGLSCVSNINEEHFGAFPAIPGGRF